MKNRIDKAAAVKLSVVIITFNEEKNIERCLKSVHGIADDIMVVDSFSTDRTEEICRQFGVRFIKHPFEGHIQQKNYAVTQAKYPHILSLDADEALSEELKQSILEVKNNWTYDGYYFNRFANYCGKWIKHSNWYPDRKLRLWNSKKGKWGGINPHDKFIMQKVAPKKFLKGDLLHYSFYSISQHMIQANKFSDIKAQGAFERGQKGGWFKILLSPLFKFVRDYFFKLGFLDGFYGFVICIIAAHSKFLKYVKLKQLAKESIHEK